MLWYTGILAGGSVVWCGMVSIHAVWLEQVKNVSTNCTVRTLHCLLYILCSVLYFIVSQDLPHISPMLLACRCSVHLY